MSSNTSAPSDRPLRGSPNAPLDFGTISAETLDVLGVPELRGCCRTGADLVAYLAESDAADAHNDGDELRRGVRRALRLEFARAAGVHRTKEGLGWKKWVIKYHGTYEVVRRYARIAQLQVYLAKHEVPLIQTVNQGRALLPYAAHPELLNILREITAPQSLPAAETLKVALLKRLGRARPPTPQLDVGRVVRIVKQLLTLLPRNKTNAALVNARELAEALRIELSKVAQIAVSRGSKTQRRRVPMAAIQTELFPVQVRVMERGSLPCEK